MVRKYIEIFDDEHCDKILVDLEGCFDKNIFNQFQETEGTGLRFIPTGVHWANKA